MIRAPNESGCITNGLPAATGHSPRMTGRAPWPPSTGAISSPCSPAKSWKRACRCWSRARGSPDFGRGRAHARRAVDAAGSARSCATGALLFTFRRGRGSGVWRARRPAGRTCRFLDRQRRERLRVSIRLARSRGIPSTRAASSSLRSAGGGGYGDPLRDPAHVREDVEEGYVSRQAAHDLYGVALDAGGVVDTVASEALRRRLRGMRFSLPTVLAEDSYERGAVSRRRICRLHPKDAAAAGLQADDLVEVDARRAAPLRAWLRIDPSVKPGSLPIDQTGLTILRASPASGWKCGGSRPSSRRRCVSPRRPNAARAQSSSPGSAA